MPCRRLLSVTVQLATENNVSCSIFPAVLEQKMATAENAPARFRSLLLLFGIEAAIENLIKVVGLEK